MNPTMPRQSIALLATLLLAPLACAVGPEYRRPPVATPPAWKELPPASEVKPAEPRETERRGKWWEAFGDPELDALEEKVDGGNFTLAIAEANFRIARAAARGARAGLLPTVSAGAAATRSELSANRPGGTGISAGAATDHELSAGLAYEVDLWGRVRRSVEAGVATAAASAADLETARLSLHAELATDYFELHGVDAQRELLDSAVASYEKALELTLNRFRQGVVSGSDVALAKTQLETTRVQATDLDSTRARLEHAIAVLVGEAPANLALAAHPIALDPPAIPVALPAELLERRPDVAAAERRAAAANAQIGIAKAAWFPSLSISAAGGYESSTLSKLLSWPSRFWSLGPALAEAIFDGGRRRATNEQALAAWDGAVASYRATVLAALAETEDGLAELRVLGAESTQVADAVAAAEHALALSRDRYLSGIANYLEVITAENSALGNERTAVDILTRRMTVSVDLIRALGGGWRAVDLPDRGAVLSRVRRATKQTAPGSGAAAPAPTPP